MAATLRIRGEVVTIDHQEISVQNAQLKTELEKIEAENPPRGWDPNPDLNLAQLFIEKLGGTLLGYDETKYVPGRVY